LNVTLRTIKSACSQLTGSKALHKLLKLMLAVGNFLNRGTPRGGAYGFKIDVLKKFAELKVSVERCSRSKAMLRLDF
jgi:hypothetical protein